MNARRLPLLWALASLVLASPAWAMGLLLPNQEGAGPLAIDSHRVAIEVRDNVATTHIDQVFRNGSAVPLEATFIFPVPRGATVHDFALWMNGERVQGEILESEQARQMYENIVRRAQDPGLVEYVDGSIFRASIFPVPANGTQRVELDFAQVLERDGDLYRLTYPLRTGRTAATTLTDFTLSVDVAASAPLRAIYSPTHEVEVVRENEQHAVVGVEQQQGNLERDFVLYLSTSEEDVGLDLFTFDEDGPAGEAGYFLMLLSPRLEREDEIAAKDVTFVVDASGSMEGDKIEQARETLRYFVGQLRAEDRFNIIRFATDTRLLFDDLTPATSGNVARAERFINRFRAGGGTGIEAALAAAIAQSTDTGRPHFIIFVTDGLPTVGETRADALVAGVEAANPGARIFTFGVGFDVDTQLLDRLAEHNGGVSDYVHPGEDITHSVAHLYERIAHPVLTDMEINFGAVPVEDVYPPEIPDLFAGDQVVLAGRFTSSAATDVSLAGYAGGSERVYRFAEDFAVGEGAANDDNDFIPQLWATRKIAFLLDQIRLNGEQAELAEEVRSLGLRYGLVTPYTSYLALDESELAQTATEQPIGGEGNRGIDAPRSATGGDVAETPEDDAVARDNSNEGPLQSSSDPAPDLATTPVVPMAPATASAEPMAAPMLETGASGRAAVERAEASRARREQSVSDLDVQVRQIGTRTLERQGDGEWRERELGGGERIEIRYLSEAYFELLAASDEARRIAALGERVRFRMGSAVVEISTTSGLETLDGDTRGLLGIR